MSSQGTYRVSAVVWIVVLCATICLIMLSTKPSKSGETNPTEQCDTLTLASATLKPFDPNTADYRTMLESGVPRNIAVSLIKWREAGKVYRMKEDVALCYNMTDSLYFALEPYIIIGEEYRIKPNREEYADTHTTQPTHTEHSIEYKPFKIDTASAEYLQRLGFTSRQAELIIKYGNIIGGYRNMAEFAECYAVDSAMAARLQPYIIFPERDTTTFKPNRIELPIDINSADSATLVHIRGIGPKSAVHILRYRKLLGGYYSTAQISELEVVTEDNFHTILPQIYCDSAKIKKIFINFARPKELEVHPYISNLMLRRIVNYRELKGGWSTIEEMIESDIFSDEEAARIAPYLDFGTSPE